VWGGGGGGGGEVFISSVLQKCNTTQLYWTMRLQSQLLSTLITPIISTDVQVKKSTTYNTDMLHPVRMQNYTAGDRKKYTDYSLFRHNLL